MFIFTITNKISNFIKLYFYCAIIYLFIFQNKYLKIVKNVHFHNYQQNF